MKKTLIVSCVFLGIVATVFGIEKGTSNIPMAKEISDGETIELKTLDLDGFRYIKELHKDVKVHVFWNNGVYGKGLMLSFFGELNSKVHNVKNIIAKKVILEDGTQLTRKQIREHRHSIMLGNDHKSLGFRVDLDHVKNKGEGTDWAKLEAECLKLVKDHNSPGESGKIYATIALIYSEKGYSSSEDLRIPKALKYCKKALEYPLEVTTACRMYGRWADSLMVTYWSYPEEEFVKRRREAIVLCLTGLKLALDNKAPKEYPKAPPVGKYHIHPEKGPIYEEAVRKHKQQLAARKKWELENKLYFQRKALTHRCVSLYSHKPYDTDELKCRECDSYKVR